MSSAESPKKAQHEAIIIEFPNRLKAKVGGSLDIQMAVKAEQAVSALAKDFRQWLEEIITTLSGARAALGIAPLTKVATESLYASALEAKSLGNTYGYALVTRFGHSLCTLLTNLKEGQAAPPALVDAHIDAMKAALRSDMRDPNHPVGLALATELEKQVQAALQTT